jgi:hypothetical protein
MGYPRHISALLASEVPHERTYDKHPFPAGNACRSIIGLQAYEPHVLGTVTSLGEGWLKVVKLPSLLCQISAFSYQTKFLLIYIKFI